MSKQLIRVPTNHAQGIKALQNEFDSYVDAVSHQHLWRNIGVVSRANIKPFEDIPRNYELIGEWAPNAISQAINLVSEVIEFPANGFVVAHSTNLNIVKMLTANNRKAIQIFLNQDFAIVIQIGTRKKAGAFYDDVFYHIAGDIVKADAYLMSLV